MWWFIAVFTALASENPRSHWVTVHGWTDDGALVYEVARHQTVWGEGENYDDSTTHHVVVQRDDQIVHDWVIAVQFPDWAVAQAPPRDVAGWAAWRDAHPLSPAWVQRVAPEGGRSLAVMAEDGPKDSALVTWTGDRAIGYGNWDEPQDSFLRWGIERGGATWWLDRRNVPTAAMSTSHTAWLRAIWSADGARLAVVWEEEVEIHMRGIDVGPVLVWLPQPAPLVSVLAPSSWGAGPAAEVARALAGVGQVQTGVAKAAREASVVYFREGYADAATSIAGRVRGGATVEPMSWEGPQDVVVALGTSAR